MLYFVGILLELQLTTVQDHSLFHSRAVFDRPLAATGEMISTYDGLISFIVHPEYTVRDRKGAYIGPCRSTSRNLLEEHNVWSAFPAEIYYWWGDCSPNKPGAKCAWRIRTRQRVGTACLCQHHRRSVLIPARRVMTAQYITYSLYVRNLKYTAKHRRFLFGLRPSPRYRGDLSAISLAPHCNTSIVCEPQWCWLLSPS